MKIICFGDSLTRGVSIVKGRLRILKESYPTSLQELFSSNKNDVTVVNKGVFNDNSDLLLERLEKDVIHEKPDYVIVGVGGNDCNFKWEEVANNPLKEHKAIVPLDRYLHNIKTMINQISQSGITPVISTLPPLDPVRYYKNISEKYSPSISHWISQVGGIDYWHGVYNHHLNQLAEELNIMKIDVRTGIKKAGNLVDLISDDGIHLTAEGYKALSAEIHRNLLSTIALQNKKLC
ncbi:lysophospholipase L1-like esterase [Metabacillus crassostreae]|uniref:SGNH/GDSL hydrolase family protein n=1 Tax=Metabacillus crassostreae TaxID=929098 RepID=UPI001957B588|nr:GDSL-type esterase/lipase family protein [Metabacillus crassostreae]MBM7603829.1 lysophospholipase L1-like esterase [Metabacillus crassostreae]